MGTDRRFAVGIEFQGSHAAFRIWAPKRRRVEVVFEGDDPERAESLVAEGDGYFSGSAPAKPGDRYWLRLDGRVVVPDPASHYQPLGPHGPSEIVDSAAFVWRDQAWRGPPEECPILYEMHIGTFTPEGSWQAAQRHLPELRDLGVTLLEIMPLAEFPGRFGWGYDGVQFFAPTRLYGRPDDLRHFVDAAHRLGLGVIVDVVYNHFGPDGNRLAEFSDDYFTDRYPCDWGKAVNFDGEHSLPVREFVLANAVHWIEAYHMDGLRLDATQQIFDASSPNIMAEIVRVVRETAARQGRRAFVVGENEPQEVRLLRRPEEGGYGLDALWNDDFHHNAVVAASGENRAYFSGYTGSPQELISAAKYGFLYQGQYYGWQSNRRGTPAFDVPIERFVNFLQNHDQIANTGLGSRLDGLTSFGRLKALTTLLLLAPGTPMLFQGQEFGASSPFLYFADHKPEIAELVREGRTAFQAQFPNLAGAEVSAALPDPASIETFRRSVLNHGEKASGRHAMLLALHRDLIRLRRDEGFWGRAAGRLDGAVLGAEVLALRYRRPARDHLLLINLGRDLSADSIAEPLMAPRAGTAWRLVWSSEEMRYGGRGTAPVESKKGWWLPAHAAVLLASESTV